MKKIMKKTIVWLFIFCTMFSMLKPMNVSAAVKLNHSSITLPRYHSAQLKLKGTKSKVKWSSKDKLVATINKNGVVKGENEGETLIIAKVGNKKYKCKVKVVHYEKKETLAAYGYRALTEMIPEKNTLKINEIRIGTYISNKEFAYFDCTFEDKMNQEQHLYFHVYLNQVESLSNFNVKTDYYDECVVVRVYKTPIEPFDSNRSEVLSTKTVKKMCDVIFRLEDITITKGTKFQEMYSWLNL